MGRGGNVPEDLHQSTSINVEIVSGCHRWTDHENVGNSQKVSKVTKDNNLVVIRYIIIIIIIIYYLLVR